MWRNKIGTTPRVVWTAVAQRGRETCRAKERGQKKKRQKGFSGAWMGRTDGGWATGQPGYWALAEIAEQAQAQAQANALVGRPDQGRCLVRCGLGAKRAEAS
ncbi:hypothetical protein RirG_011240 [Rhizophagus irregularis DAOM 197198w]|uniref:Uncharacterized protein n=1 Tax=Rhizophagus irregularis (strain DAOM 197198w) TaxID=1432141 RepID=A0A015M1J0_RHIIW|nr:hypothetical protein RirG_011240 [Rhizophagus irregularis DAOM 197198w]